METKKETRSTPKRLSRKKSPEPSAPVELEITDAVIENPVESEKLTPKMTVGDEPHKEGNRYAPKMKVGTPTLGRSPQFVTEVGLGNLQVTTNGKRAYN